MAPNLSGAISIMNTGLRAVRVLNPDRSGGTILLMAALCTLSA
jgi:hypothetical protein